MGVESYMTFYPVGNEVRLFEGIYDLLFYDTSLGSRDVEVRGI